MSISRRASGFLVAVGAFQWVVWLTFARNLVGSDESRSFVVIHGVLAAVSILLGTGVAMIGLRGWRASRQATVSERALRSFMQSGTRS